MKITGTRSHPQDTQFDNPTDLQPGRSDAPQQDSEQLTHGQETYPGPRAGDAEQGPAPDPPNAGDADPDATASATETGQDGDLTDPSKKKAHNYS